MNAEFWPAIVEVSAWAIAAAWCVKTTEALKNLPLMTNLAELEWDVWLDREPSLCVVVPARDEAANIGATLDTLVQQDYKNLRVLAVDDRSTDGTAALMDAVAARRPERLSVIHVTELPEGWLGKTHALELALRWSGETEKAKENTQVAGGLQSNAEVASKYVLFTDGDVLFSPSVLRRALAYAEREQADHVVVMPTMQIKSWDEGVLLGFFQVMGLWSVRPWRMANPKARRDTLGVGAFNLFRRDALLSLGGLEPQRMVVLEDVTLARRMKAAGMRQRVVFAPGLVLVHWAAGARGLIRVMTKNLFSAFNFNPLLALGGCFFIVLFCLGPLAGLAWWGAAAPSLLVMACVAVTYRVYGELSWIEPKYGWGVSVGSSDDLIYGGAVDGGGLEGRWGSVAGDVISAEGVEAAQQSIRLDAGWAQYTRTFQQKRTAIKTLADDVYLLFPAQQEARQDHIYLSLFEAGMGLR